VTGLNFEGLLKVLIEVDALNAFQLTEKERLSVLSTQIIKALMLYVNMISEVEGSSTTNSMDANDAFNRFQPFDGVTFAKPRVLVGRSIK